MEDESVIKDEVAEALGTDESELGLSSEEAKIVARVLPLIADKANRAAESKKMAELQQAITTLTEENKKAMTAAVEKIKKDLTPPSPEDIEAILSQEYLEFPLKLKGSDRTFVIRELPLEAETKIVKAVQKTLAERLTEISRVDWSAGMTVLDRINRVVEMVPGALETLSDCVAVCLDPYGETLGTSGSEINGAWVRRNLSSNRIVAIIHAQIQAGRYRDFLSIASKLFPTLTTT